MAVLNIAHITKLPTVVGFTWRQIALLAALGVAIGLALALTVRIPVS
jgi:hypothetical protein